MCGEKRMTATIFATNAGSPPRVRGKEFAYAGIDVYGRITPACAGKSPSPCSEQCKYWDHPRMCGEKFPTSMRTARHAGSPPHVRGKAMSAVPERVCVGITPACAGKRDAGPRSQSEARDHPRMCGEKRVTVTPMRASTGSPPHVRGKDADTVPAVRCKRITPACAGKSVAPFSYPLRIRDHPRMCGEK